MSRILLLLAHLANRHLLAEALGTRHETLAPGSDDALDLPFDLGVMDGPALDRLGERVRARRAAVQPQFLPFLLVVSRHDVGMATRHLWRTVDELIFTPIEKVELQARVENLLHARRLSTEQERRVAERTAALRESKARFATAFRSNPAGVVITTLEEGRFLDANEAFLRIFGLTRAQVIGRTSAELGLLLSPETRREAAMKVRQIGAFRDCELPFRRPDGSPGCLLCSGERLVLNGQECLVTLLLDITDRRRAEERLRRLNRTYEMLSQINELIVRERDPRALLERACRIAVDKGGFRMAWLGLRASPDGPLKRAAHAGATPDTLAVLEQLFGDPPQGCAFTDRALETGRPAVCNDIARDPLAAAWRAAALERSYRAMVALPVSVAGQPVGTFNLYASDAEFFDEEELRLLDELAADLGFALEVSRREAERRQLEEQLRHAQKMETIGQLAGGVAHDFNNILAAILMQTELLRMRTDLPPRVPEGLQQIQAAVERATHLTRPLLTFSRKQVLQPRNLDLNRAITDLVKMLRRIIGEDIRLEVRLHPAPLRLRADAGMLDQVLMNLVVNARDAMPRGGQLVIESFARELGPAEAATRPAVAPGRYVGLRVRDTGSGIAPEHLSHIFEPFFTTKEPGKGTGLGLATVFGIVQQHGGWIEVASEDGRGSAFEVCLPALAGEEAGPAGGAGAGPPQGGTETLLLVEDEAALREVARRVLEHHGYQVLEAATAAAALALWEQHADRIRLLVTGLVLPEGLNGRELAARLRERRPDLPVLFSSGYSPEMMAGRGLVLERRQRFLQKPAPPHDLLRAVRECLDEA